MRGKYRLTLTPVNYDAETRQVSADADGPARRAASVYRGGRSV